MIVKNEERMKNEVNIVLEQLQNTYKEVAKKEGEARDALYGLLDDCVEFYSFLTKEPAYQEAFKRIINFRWNKHAGLPTLITKMVFGVKNKNAYAYAKVMNAAINQDILNKNITVSQWIIQNGGINKLIRSTQSSTQAEEDRNYRIEVGRNAELYESKLKAKAISAPELANAFKHGSEAIFLLSRDDETGVVSVVWLSQSEEMIDMMYEDKGANIMKSNYYHDRKVEVEKILREQRAESERLVSEEMKKLSAKLQNSSAFNTVRTLDMKNMEDENVNEIA